MSENTKMRCIVTTFYSPSLFWIVYEDDIVKRHKYNERFNKPLVQFDSINHVSLNQKVILRHREVWYRAEVFDIRQVSYKEKYNQSKPEYICWLIDYGYFVPTYNVYKLPENELLIPPFARKTMLYGIRSASLEKIEDDWVPGIRRYAYDILKAPETSYEFRKQFNFEDYLIGDLFIVNGDESENIKDKFMEKGLAVGDEVYFMSKLQMLVKLEVDMTKVYLETRFFIEDAKRLLDSPERIKGHPTFRAMQTYFIEKEKQNTKIDIDISEDEDVLSADKPVSGRARKCVNMYGIKQQNAKPVGSEHTDLSKQKLYGNTVLKNLKMNSSATKTLEDNCKNYDDADFDLKSVKQQPNIEEFVMNVPSSAQSRIMSNLKSSIQSAGRGSFYRKNAEDSSKQLTNNLENSNIINNGNENDALIDNIRFGKVQKQDEYDLNNSSITTDVSIKNVTCDLNKSEWCYDLNQVKFIGRSLLKIPRSFQPNSDTEVSCVKEKDRKQNSNENIQEFHDIHEIVHRTQNLDVENKQDKYSETKKVHKNRTSIGRGYDKSNNENKSIINNAVDNFAKNKNLKDNSDPNSKDNNISGRNNYSQNTFTSKKRPKIFGRDYGSKILSILNDDENPYKSSGDTDHFIDSDDDYHKKNETFNDFKSKYSGRGSSNSERNFTRKSDEMHRTFGRGFIADKISNKTTRHDFEDSKSTDDSDSFVNNNMELKVDDVFKDIKEAKNVNKNSSAFRKYRENEVQLCPAGAESNLFKKNENFLESINPKRPPQKNGCNDNYVDKSEKTECTKKATKIAGLCECNDCEKWRNNDNVFDPPPIIIHQPKEREIIKPPLLFKTDNEEPTKFKIKTKRNFANDTEKLAAPRLLVHGSLLVDPTNDIPHTPFNEIVQYALRELNYTNAYSIQSYAWPSILRGHNCIIVGPSGSGKTMSYVPPICQFVLNPNPFLPEGNGPIAVIFCPRVDVVENVNRLFGSILRKNLKTTILSITQILERPNILRLLKICDVLITTPRLFIKLLKDDLVNLNRLNYVILDEAQDLYSLFAPEINYILHKIHKNLENRTDGIPIQLITLSQEWNKHIEYLAKRFKIPPFICIGSHLEAALYGRADIKLQIIDSKHKVVKLVDLIKNTNKKCKLIIICNDNDDSNEIKQHFIAHGIEHEILLTESAMEEINVVKQRWSNVATGHNFILVCSDNIFNTGLAISDADFMIQYSLPDNWSQFIYRFSCFIDNYNSPLDLNITEVKLCHMHIFIDETNTLQFPKMLQFLQRMGSKLTDKLEKLYHSLVRNAEMKKVETNIKICENLLRFGSCKNHLSCKYRHILCPKTDISTTLPKLGLIKCKILNIISPMQFSTRLLEYTDGEGVIHKVKDDFSLIATQLLSLKEEGIPIPVSQIKVGRFCAVQETSGIFKGSFLRCVIIDVIKGNGDSKLKKVLVKFIDIGHVQYVNHAYIYFLPKEFQKYPAQSVPVYISNIGPLDKDVSWSRRCLTSINIALKHAGYGQANTYFTGRIKLQLRDSIFVDDLKLIEILDDDDDSLIIQRLSICNILKKLKCIENRPEHLKNLYDLCNMYKIPLQNYNLPVIKKNIKEKPQVKPSWAHLENGEEFNNVYLCMAHNPDTFFVKLNNNIDRLEKLNKDIASTINKPFYPKITSPKEGNCYLVKDSVEQTYSRVILRKIKDNIGECLFVDYGDIVEVSLQELRYLPDNLITQLPFQAIECKLYGIEPSGFDDHWIEESTNILYNFAYEPDSNEIWRVLHVKIMADETPEYTGYKKYSVILVDTFKDKQIINNIILDMGYAVSTTENPIAVDFNKINIKNNNSDSEEEKLDEEENLKDITNEKENEVFEYKELDFNDDDRWDLCINNPEEFFPDFFKVPDEEQKSGAKIEEIPQKTKEEKYITNIKALPAPAHGCSTPNLVWQQTDTHIIIKIQIPSIDYYDLKIVRNRMLAFRGKYKETSYRLDLNLYAKVYSLIDHSDMGLYIYAKIQKEETVEWPRLVLSKTKQRNITYNVAVIPLDDDFDYDDDNPLTKRMIENSKQLGDDFKKDAEEGPYRFEIGSDIDWDESDIESDKDSDDY